MWFSIEWIDTYSYVKPGNFSSGQLVKDSNLINPLYLVSPACDSTRLTLPIWALVHSISACNYCCSTEKWSEFYQEQILFWEEPMLGGTGPKFEKYEYGNFVFN